jgi:hypothetical protein
MKQDIDFGTMTAFDITREMKHKSFYSNPFQALSHILNDDIESKQNNRFHSTQKPILETKYNKADLNEVIAEQFFFNETQKAKLYTIFKK